jgi:hypothetical protein
VSLVHTMYIHSGGFYIVIRIRPDSYDLHKSVPAIGIVLSSALALALAHLALALAVVNSATEERSASDFSTGVDE